MGTVPKAGGRQVVWICRHGNRIDLVDPSWEGLDPHLSADGVVQAQETGARLRDEGIEHIFASPFLRTVETAYHIAEALDLSVKIEHGACEWLGPDWIPKPGFFIPVDEMHRRFPRVDTTYESRVFPIFPESADALSDRCRRAAIYLADTYKSDILVVGHGASVVRLTHGFLGQECSMSCGLCSLTKVIRTDGRWTLELNGDVSHLSSGEKGAYKFN